MKRRAFGMILATLCFGCLTAPSRKSAADYFGNDDTRILDSGDPGDSQVGPDESLTKDASPESDASDSAAVEEDACNGCSSGQVCLSGTCQPRLSGSPNGVMYDNSLGIYCQIPKGSPVCLPLVTVIASGCTNGEGDGNAFPMIEFAGGTTNGGGQGAPIFSTSTPCGQTSKADATRLFSFSRWAIEECFTKLGPFRYGVDDDGDWWLLRGADDDYVGFSGQLSRWKCTALDFSTCSDPSAPWSCTSLPTIFDNGCRVPDATFDGSQGICIASDHLADRLIESVRRVALLDEFAPAAQ